MKSGWLGLAVIGLLGSSGCGPLMPSSPAPAPAAAPQASTSPPGASLPAAEAVASAQSVKLSAGVALPQSLPDGTVMTFSVDYRFRAGAPDAAAKYVWIIQPSRGKALEIPVALEESGTVQAISGELRPDDGPFQGSFVVVAADGTRSAISEAVALR